MKANTIIVSFNNGSVPPQYAYRYQILFSEQDGNAELKIFRGYETDEKMIVSEQRKFNTEIFLQLLSLISKIKDSVKDPSMVGGSQRMIEVNSKKSRSIRMMISEFLCSTGFYICTIPISSTKLILTLTFKNQLSWTKHLKNCL